MRKAEVDIVDSVNGRKMRICKTVPSRAAWNAVERNKLTIAFGAKIRHRSANTRSWLYMVYAL